MKMLCKVKLSEHKYKTPEGYLYCKDAIIARTGKQTYLESEIFEGSTSDDYVEVDRREEEVFSPETMASFENKPLTIEHPNTSVGPENYKDLSVGHVQNVRKGEYEGQPVMLADIVVNDAEAIRLIESGEMVELSCGYDCDITDGPNPEQINIRGNHVALCEAGRAGIAMIVDSKKKWGAQSIQDSVSRGTLIQEFGKQGKQYKIAKIVNNVIYAESLETGKTILFKKDEENIEWAVITKSEVKDSNETNEMFDLHHKYYVELQKANRRNDLEDLKQRIDKDFNSKKLSEQSYQELLKKYESKIDFLNHYGLDSKVKDEYKYDLDLAKNIFDRLKEGTNADLPKNIRKEIMNAGGEIESITIKPQHIVVYWHLKDFTGGNDIYLKPEIFETDLKLLAEDIAHAVSKTQNVKDSEVKDEMIIPNIYSSKFDKNELDKFIKEKESSNNQTDRKMKIFTSQEERDEFMKSLPEEADVDVDEFDHEFPDGRYLVWWEVYYWDKKPIIESSEILDFMESFEIARIYNCLYRYIRKIIGNGGKIETIKDFVDSIGSDYNQLVSIRNLGKKAAFTVAQDLIKKGYDIKNVPEKLTTDSNPYIIELEDKESWLDINDKPTSDKTKARRFSSKEEAESHMNTYCKGSVCELVEDTYIEDNLITDRKLESEEVIANVDVDHYLKKDDLLWAKDKSESELLTKAYWSKDNGQTWYTAGLYGKAANPKDKGKQTQVGKMQFMPIWDKGYIRPIGRNILTWYTNNNIHEYDPNYEIDHIDNDYTNDHLSNLQRLTPRENNLKRGEAKKLEYAYDSISIMKEGEEIANLLDNVDFDKITESWGSLVIDFSDPEELKKAAEILVDKYDIELFDDDDDELYISVYDKFDQPKDITLDSKDTWLGIDLIRGEQSKEFKEYLRDRGLYFEPSSNGDFVHFEIKNGDEFVKQRADDIRRHYAKAKDGYSKKFYSKMIKELQNQLDELEKNEMLDENNHIYEKQKNRMKESLKKQIAEYQEKLNNA